MTYWALRPDYSSKEAGNVFPQVNCLSQIQAHAISGHEDPSFEVKLKYELEPRAKYTDVIAEASIPATGLLISEKIKTIFDKHQLPGHKYFETVISSLKGEEARTYYWLHIYNPSSLDWIDYSSSKFFYTEYGFREGEVEIESFKHSRIVKEKLVGNMGTIESDAIVLNSTFDRDLDLFNFEHFDSDIHISDRLKRALISQGLTGLEIKKSICCYKK